MSVIGMEPAKSAFVPLKKNVLTLKQKEGVI